MQFSMIKFGRFIRIEVGKPEHVPPTIRQRRTRRYLIDGKEIWFKRPWLPTTVAALFDTEDIKALRVREKI